MTQHPSQQYTPPGGSAGDRWSRRPHRSANDRKIAGVAGGLGRAFGIDPIILRVAFVVLAIFGGSGVLLYALGWLLLPADGDDVSAVEGLIGRGRSSVSPMFTILLVVIALFSAGSVFSWGLPFWPIVIGAILVFLFARRRRISHGGWNSSAERDWNKWGDDVADRATRWADDFSDRASRWGQRAGQWSGPRGGRHWGVNWGGQDPTGWSTSDPAGDPGAAGGSGSAGGPGSADGRGSAGGQGSGSVTGPSSAASRSPFDAPAFWDADPYPATRGTRGPATTTNQSERAKGAGPNVVDNGPRATGTPDTATTAAGTPAVSSTAPSAPSPSEMLAGNRTPPAWDPLGVAPFAWDLPDPTPLPEAPVGPQQSSGRSALSRAFVGVGLLAGAVAAVGVIAGWWALSWAEVSAIALAVVGVGLILAALRGRGRPLIGPGIFLALLTLALTITGVNGTQNYGDKVWTPASVAEIDNQTFNWNAGGGKLDLSDLVIPTGTTATTTLDVRAGQATVVVPSNVTVHATCSANVGQVDCLTVSDDGMRPEATATQLPVAGSTAGGILNLTVRVGAGAVTVRHD